MSGDKLALASAGLLALASMAGKSHPKQGSRAGGYNGNVAFDPQRTIIYFDLIMEEDLAAEYLADTLSFAPRHTHDKPHPLRDAILSQASQMPPGAFIAMDEPVPQLLTRIAKAHPGLLWEPQSSSGAIGQTLHVTWEDFRILQALHLLEGHKPPRERSGQAALRAENRAVQEISKALNMRVYNEGHHERGFLICKLLPDSLDEVLRIWRWVDEHNIGSSEDDPTVDVMPFFSAGDWIIFPEGINKGGLRMHDWKERLQRTIAGTVRLLSDR
jgi:hypothetical protein